MLVSQTSTKPGEGGSNFCVGNALGFGLLDPQGGPLLDVRNKRSGGIGNVFDANVANNIPIDVYIPVARVADMLLHPGELVEYDGDHLVYPDVRLVYWCGGNPFHHHQDLARLRRALSRAETIVVHEPFWTATARHADIILPATMTLERNDIGAANNDPYVIAMHQALAPYAQARNDYDIFQAPRSRQISDSSAAASPLTRSPLPTCMPVSSTRSPPSMRSWTGAGVNLRSNESHR